MLYKLTKREMNGVKAVLATKPDAIYQVITDADEEVIKNLPSENEWVFSADFINVQAAKDVDGRVYLRQRNYTDDRVFVYPKNIADAEVSDEAVAKFKSESEEYIVGASTPRWIEMLQNHEYAPFYE